MVPTHVQEPMQHKDLLMVQNQSLPKHPFFFSFKEELTVSRYIQFNKKLIIIISTSLTSSSKLTFMSNFEFFFIYFSATLVMPYLRTRELYKFQYKEKFVYSAYMKLVGPMSYFCNGRMLLTHFCSLNVIQDGQKVSIAIFHQVCQFYNILFEAK